MPGCAGPASSLGASRQGRGARARRRRPEERLRPGSTAGLPGASVGGPPSRGGAVRRSRSFLHAAAPRRPPLHTRNSAHPGKRRGTRCSRRGAGSALRAPSPGSLAGRPASRHFLSKNGARRRGRRRRRSGRAPVLPRSGPAAWGVAVYRRGGASAGALPGGEASGERARPDTSGRRPGAEPRPGAGRLGAAGHWPRSPDPGCGDTVVISGYLASGTATWWPRTLPRRAPTPEKLPDRAVLCV